MTQIESRNLDGFTFISGQGSLSDKQLCVMTAASYLAGEPFSDHPLCACPVITSMAIRLNDAAWWASDQERTETLRPLAERVVGTRGGDALESLRRKRAAVVARTVFASMAFGWAASAMRSAGLVEHADKLQKVSQAYAGGAANTDAAADAATDAAYAAYAAAYAANTDAAANAAKDADAAANAANAAAYAANAAYAAATDAAATDAANAATDAATDAANAATDAANAAAYAAYAANAAYAAATDAANAATYARMDARRPARDALVNLINELCDMKEGDA